MSRGTVAATAAGCNARSAHRRRHRRRRRLWCLGTLAGLGLSLVPGDAAVASSGGVVAVGAILPLSGLFSTLGPPERDAMQMAIEAINTGGGFTVAGKQHTLAVKVLDDESSPATVGISDYRQLVEVDRVPVLVLADNTRIYAAQFRRAPLPVLNILDSTYPSILDVDKHVFLLRSDTPAYVPGGVWYLKNVLHASRISFIGSAADPYSKGIEIWMRKSAKQYGLEVVSDVNYPPDTTSFAPFIQQAMAAKPDAIYLGGVTQEVLPVAKQLYQSGVRGLPVLHNAGATPTQARQIIGDPLYNDVMRNNYDFAGSLPQTSTDPATQAFFRAFQTRFKEYPDDLTMWAYDAPFVLVAAMQKAGSVTDRDAITRAMLTMKVPPHTISGWIPTQDGALFHDRDAQTLAEGVGWCPDQKTIGAVFLYFMDAMDVTRKQLVQNGCSGP